MSKERRKKLTPAELKAAGVSREVVVRKVRRIPHSPGPIVPDHHGPGESGKRGVLSVDLFDVDVAERVEAELDAFVKKRAREARDHERVEDLWKASEFRHRKKCREENAAAWRSYHLGQAERLERTADTLAANHRAKAAALLNGELA